ncbi:hypothetical protein Q3G72_021473 [Acer saccharum]|nr:hypothetical protein Q3G72_021473 [Acer saccharum]
MSGDALKKYKIALRITDGALLVVDCAKVFSFHTETILRQSLGERIRPVLAINKIDRCLNDLLVDGEQAYQMFRRVIEDVNNIMGTYNDPHLGDVQVCPEKGTVAFTAGIHDWGFTLKDFSDMYASRFGVDESTMMQRLWGNNFFNYKTNEWTNMNTGSPTCMRGFVYCFYEPIKGIINICMKDGKDELWIELKKVDVSIDCKDDKKLKGKPLVRRVIQCWLPAGKTLLKMMILHLPSLGEAQKYRVGNLYQGPLNDVYANAIQNCDLDGVLTLYVSKLVVHKPTAIRVHKSNAKGYFYGFGCVFSRKVTKGLKVRIMGPNYVPRERDSYIKKVETVCVWLGMGLDNVEDYVPCGNTVALFGIDEFISKTATLTNESEVDAHLIRAMKFSVQPVVRAAI